MPSRIDEAGHTKAFDYPVAEHWGEAEMFSSAGGHKYKVFVYMYITAFFVDFQKFHTFWIDRSMVRHIKVCLFY